MNESNINNINQNTQEVAKKENTSKSNDFIAMVVILGLVLAGGIYAYFQTQEFAHPLPSPNRLLSPKRFAPVNKVDNDPVLSAPESTSTDIEAIEKDLDMTDLDTLDKDLQDLDNI